MLNIKMDSSNLIALNIAVKSETITSHRTGVARSTFSFPSLLCFPIHSFFPFKVRCEMRALVAGVRLTNLGTITARGGVIGTKADLVVR